MSSLVVTLVGPDRPGLVGAVSDVVRTHGGNWLESRMSRLAGQFAGIILIDVAAAHATALASGLEQLSNEGLKVIVEQDTASAAGAGDGRLMTMNVVANDRGGIVREVTSVLAQHNVNVEEFTSECTDAPQGGSRIFKAQARLRLPDNLALEQLQEELENLATDLMIDFSD